MSFVPLWALQQLLSLYIFFVHPIIFYIIIIVYKTILQLLLFINISALKINLTYQTSSVIVVKLHQCLNVTSPPVPRVHEVPGLSETKVNIVSATAPFPLAITDRADQLGVERARPGHTFTLGRLVARALHQVAHRARPSHRVRYSSCDHCIHERCFSGIWKKEKPLTK